MKRRTIIFMLVAAIMLAAKPAAAQDNSDLKGLTEVAILIETIDSNAQRDGLDQSQLKTEIELRLRRNGIKVVSDTNAEAGFLYINVNTIKNEGLSLYGFAINVQYVQWVRLKRDPSVLVMAKTWTTGSVGLAGSMNLKIINEGVLKQIDQFCNAYLAANPK